MTLSLAPHTLHPQEEDAAEVASLQKRVAAMAAAHAEEAAEDAAMLKRLGESAAALAASNADAAAKDVERALAASRKRLAALKHKFCGGSGSGAPASAAR